MRRVASVAMVGAAFTTPAAAEAPWVYTASDVALEASRCAPAIVRQRAFGGPGGDQAYDIWPTADGHFVLAGSAEHPQTGGLDALVLKLDAEARPLWAKTFGGEGVEIAFAVRELKDGTILVAGWTQSVGAGEGDFHVLGLGADGALKFEKTFGGAGEERATSLVVTRDGGAAIVGESYSHGDGDSRFYLVKIAADGTLEWERTYDGGPLHERGLAVLELEDGYLLAGNQMDTTSGSTAKISNGFAVRTGPDGEERWSRAYGEDAHDIIHHLAPMKDGDALLTGYTRGFGAKGENDIWLVAIDAETGEPKKTRLVGGDGADHNIGARADAAGAIHLSGYSQSGGAGGWDGEIIRLDPSGEPGAAFFYGGPGNDGFTMAHPIGGGTVVAGGYTESFGAGGRDVLFVELAPMGDERGCDAAG